MTMSSRGARRLRGGMTSSPWRNVLIGIWAAFVVVGAVVLALHTRIAALVVIALLGVGAVVVVILVAEVYGGREDDTPAGSTEEPPEEPPRTP